MRLSQASAVTMKDFEIFRRKRYILYSLIAGPLAISVLLPESILLSTSPGEIPAATLGRLFGGEFTIFIMLAALLPSVIGAYRLHRGEDREEP